MVWYSHLFKNLSVCCDLHKGFSLVNEAEVDFLFLEFLCFFYDPMDVGNLTLWFYVISKLEAMNYLDQYKEHSDIYTFEQDK